MIHSPSRLLSVKSFRLFSLVTFASLSAMSMNASGAVAIGVSSILYLDGPGPVSNSDLVNTGSPDLMFFSSTAFLNPSSINDGVGTYDGWSSLSEELGDFPGLTTFHLNVVANPMGYEITQFRIFTANYILNGLPFFGNVDNHRYIIDYSVVGSADFETLTTVDISGAGGFTETWVTINPVPALTGVDVIRITWLDPLPTATSLTTIMEVDIEGSPITQVPEPSSFMLSGMILGGACLRRIRKIRR